MNKISNYNGLVFKTLTYTKFHVIYGVFAIKNVLARQHIPSIPRLYFPNIVKNNDYFCMSFDYSFYEKCEIMKKTVNSIDPR